MAQPVVRRVLEEVRSYAAPGDDRPLGGYVSLLAVYGLSGSALSLLVLRRRRRFELSTRDLLLLSVATFKLSRVITRDSVTSPIRAPFTRFEGPADAPSEVNESVRGTGVRKAVGELITCPFCVGQWVCTGLIAGLMAAPRATRLLIELTAATAAADALQLAYAKASSGD